MADDRGLMPREEWKRTSVHAASRYYCGRCGEQFEDPHAFYEHIDHVEHSAPRAPAQDAEVAHPPVRRVRASQPSYADLMTHLERFGPDGIVESARHLSEPEIEELTQAAKAARKKKTKR